MGFTSLFDQVRLEVLAYRSTSELGTTNSFNEVCVYEPVRAPQEIWGYEGLVTIKSLKRSIGSHVVTLKEKYRSKRVLGLLVLFKQRKHKLKPSDTLSLTVSYLYVGDRKPYNQMLTATMWARTISTAILLT